MKRWILAGLLALVASHAAAFDPVRAPRYASPDMYRPNVDAIIARGTGDAVQSAGNVVCTSGNCLLSGFSGFNLRGSAGTTLFARPTLNGANGITLYSSSSDFSTPKGFEILADKLLLNAASGVTLLPKANSLAKAFTVVQSGPTSGSVAGPVALNSFDMSWSSEVTGNYGAPGLVGSGAVLGMQYSMNVGGPNLKGQQFFTLSAGLTHDRNDTSTGDKGAFSAGIHSSASTNGLLDGAVFSVVADNGSSSPQIAGVEVDMTILGTGTTPNRLGFVAVNTGAKTATVADIAYAATSAGPDGTIGGSWRTLIGLYKQDPSLPDAMQPTGSIFASDHNLTIKNVLDGHNLTVTDNILLFPGVVLTGAGKLTTSQVDLYGNPPAVATGHVSYGGATTGPSFCGSLAGASGCVAINANGTQRYIPFW